MKALDPRIPALVPGFDAPFFLGGMAGYGDTPFRALCRALGCPFAVTESMQASILVRGGKGLRRAEPNRVSGGLRDHPLAAQLLGADPEEMRQAATLVAAMSYEVVDVNLACPCKRATGRKPWGGNLLGDPERAIEVLRAVRAGTPDDLPVTVKMRRGLDEGPQHAEAFERIFEAAGELGYAWVTVHCRTVEQRYVGESHWPFLADLVARHPKRLVFGSGDVWRAGDVERMREETGVHAVSVARGAIQAPWIFQELRRRWKGAAASPPSLAEAGALLRGLLAESVRHHGSAEATRRVRKLALRVVALHPRPAEARARIVSAASLGGLEDVLATEFSEDTAVGVS